jgi:cytochrome c553
MVSPRPTLGLVTLSLSLLTACDGVLMEGTTRPRSNQGPDLPAVNTGTPAVGAEQPNTGGPGMGMPENPNSPSQPDPMMPEMAGPVVVPDVYKDMMPPGGVQTKPVAPTEDPPAGMIGDGPFFCPTVTRASIEETTQAKDVSPQFVSAGCAACHGARGLGSADYPEIPAP